MIKKPIDITEGLNEVKTVLFQIFGKEYVNFKEETKKDIETFMRASKNKLERWTTLLSKKQITLDEYEWLVKSQKELFVFNELEKAGVSKMRIRQLRKNTIKAVLDIGKSLVKKNI
ncbi:hypothetical protein [Flagellimonas meridianipacifica]|uniref:Uncharacterized protein n=1 Tax=Flagellimonas meridianipacifica TaxID=1080225 RepID=A0A2T0M8I1_9FLAO|nr:hypothetical protein [Allomuricauda pacifica]PRX53778.1 hypothetical protein CLV81_2165 [Allomuricauda pacifica]